MLWRLLRGVGGGFGEKKFAREDFHERKLADDACAHAGREGERGDDGRRADRRDHPLEQRTQTLPKERRCLR